MSYGIKINFKGGEKVIEVGEAYEHRKQTPVFALGNGDGSSNLETADSIRTNWNSWAKDYFKNKENYPRLSVAEAEQEGIEVI